MYNIIKDVLREIDEEFNPFRLRYWKPSRHEIVMVIILLSIVWFAWGQFQFIEEPHCETPCNSECCIL